MMIETKTFYEKNEYFLESPVNVLFEDLLEMTPDEFTQWVIDMRKTVVNIWDDHGVPPRRGKTEQAIIDQFNKMCSYPVHEFTHTDELSDVEDDVIINKSRLGAEADQWFPTMYKTRINYTEKDNGYSIYDLFAKDKYKERMIKGCFRHFRRDSMYIHALTCFKNNKKPALIECDDAETFIRTYHDYQGTIFSGYDFMLEQVTIREGVNTGYFQVDQSNILQLTKEQVEVLKRIGLLEYRHHSTFDIDNMSDDKVYSIRLYKKGERIFPKGFPAFRIGYIQPAVNFPPMTAKYLYERFTDEIKDQEKINIYDPSAGWGGRILGCMACRDDRVMHYIGTDPNPDNHLLDGCESRYSALANFYNTKTYRGNPFFSSTNSYEIFKLGSEEIQYDEDFKKYRGTIDLIFTSPPYFNREAYSENEKQSYKKFGSSYEEWREGFLRPTLETCAKWLKPNRYLLWNIADLKIGEKYLPLEKDSIEILESHGMMYRYKVKMALEGMPGQNRLDEDGKPKCKNFCKINDTYMKYEPILVFYKENE
jgi:hypothetical protein|tara:strand:+ start:192 stop:1799 length:1608 start_codon:yes stop_codon:yes gene_type:complete